MSRSIAKRIVAGEIQQPIIDEDDLGECTNCEFRRILHDPKYDQNGNIKIRCRKQRGRVHMVPKGVDCAHKDTVIYSGEHNPFPIGFNESK